MFYSKSFRCLSTSLVIFSGFDENRKKLNLSSYAKAADERHSVDLSVISIFYSNVRSLIPKLHDLYNYISLYHPSVIAITESWLNSSFPSSFFCPPNYNAYRHDRSNGRGGGVIIFVLKEVFSFPVNVADSDLHSSRVNATACQIALQDSNNTVGLLCIYRPPDSTNDDNQVMLNMMTSFLSNNFDYNIILGDFNYPDINWPLTASSHQGSLFLNFCQEHFLHQNICEPTRRVSGNILDLVLTSVGTGVSNISINEEFASSDHAIIQFDLNLRPSCCNLKRMTRNFKNADWNLFRTLLWDFPDWHNALAKKDIDVVWSHFVNMLHVCLDKVAPLKSTSARNRISSARVRTALRHKRRCLRALNANPNIITHLTYVRAALISEIRIKQDLCNRESYILDNPNPKVFWSYINSRLKKTSTISFIHQNQHKITDSKEIADAFNEYFSSIFNVMSSNSNNKLTNSRSSKYDNITPLDSFSVRINDVAKILHKLPNKRSLDPDGLSYFILKMGGFPIIHHLYHIFTLSFELGLVPSSWKVALVSPIHKNGSKDAVDNYRPISVTSCCSRILEKIVKNRLTEHLLRNRIINTSQHGFLPGCSTETILATFYDRVTSHIDGNSVVDVVFFDFQKAFDTVPHHVLISKLAKCGIEHRALQWVSHFLLNRQQKVKINNVFSDPRSVNSGVIQGSVLGPTLFNVFINDVDKVIQHGHILKYADDIRIFLSSSKNDLQELKNKLQQDINFIFDWATKSGMSFNVNKCFTVSFGCSNEQRTYSINNKCIPQRFEYKDLGIIVQSPLSFKTHINTTISKAFSTLGLIKKLFVKRDKCSTVKLYNAFVLPTLEYASIIWSPHSVSQSDNIERVQKRMCRLIPDIRDLHYHEQLQSLGLFSLHIRRIRYQLTFIYKVLMGLVNVDFDEMFDRRRANRTRGHNANLTARFARLNCRLHFFSTSAIQYWNKLPYDIIKSSSLNDFKNKLDAYLRSPGVVT